MADHSLQIQPIAGALGAEITGVDLAEDLDEGTIETIRRAWLDHLVVFFRGQELPPERLLAFARRFGEIVEYPFIRGIECFPLITPVVKLEDERVNFGGLWHTDTAYLEHPPMGTMLVAREVPPYGGDTLFANLHLAYEALSSGMQRLPDGLVAINSPPRPTSPRRARTGFATVPGPTRSAGTSLSTRSCAPTREPTARRSTSIPVTRCASRT